MASARATFASMGVSVALVAAAALALLAVSWAFAFGGRTVGLGSSATRSIVIGDGSMGSDPDILASDSRRAAATPVVLRAPRHPPAFRERLAEPQAMPTSIAAPETHADLKPILRRPAAVVAVLPRQIAPLAAVEQLRTGDAVRRVGDDVSSTVQKVGTSLTNAAAPLGPPVSQAVQDVLDRLAITVKQTTDGLAGPLDKVLAPKK